MMNHEALRMTAVTGFERAALDTRSAEIAARIAELDRRRVELATVQIVPACALGVPGCGIVTVHSHCSRAGCTITAKRMCACTPSTMSCR